VSTEIRIRTGVSFTPGEGWRSVTDLNGQYYESAPFATEGEAEAHRREIRASINRTVGFFGVTDVPVGDSFTTVELAQ
jgi:hypothetical protein